MKITDEDAAKACVAFYGEEQWQRMGTGRGNHDELLAAMKRALATQPDRYREGFEKARGMAALLLEKINPPIGDAADYAQDIRNMEMPDE